MMESKKYFIYIGNKEEGPFEIDELKKIGLTNSTPIWHVGLSTWTTADQIEELKAILLIQPPPFSTAVTPPPYESKKEEASFSNTIHAKSEKKIKTRIIIVVAIIAAMILTVLFYFQRGNQKPAPSIASNVTAEQPNSIRAIEETTPLLYLNLKGKFQPSINNENFIINGEIKNSATITYYKDIKIVIEQLSNTNTILEKAEYTLDEIIKPNSSKSFYIKLKRNRRSKNLSCDIINATALREL